MDPSVVLSVTDTTACLHAGSVFASYAPVSWASHDGEVDSEGYEQSAQQKTP